MMLCKLFGHNWVNQPVRTYAAGTDPILIVAGLAVPVASELRRHCRRCDAQMIVGKAR